MEVKDKHNIDLDPSELKGLNAKGPQQPNFCDCGVYLLETVETFFKRPLNYLNLMLVGYTHLEP